MNNLPESEYCPFCDSNRGAIERIAVACHNIQAQLSFAGEGKPEKVTIKSVRALRLACDKARTAIKEATDA